MNNKTKLLNCLCVGGISGLMGINHYNVLANNQSLEILWNKEITHNGYEGFNSVIQTKDGGFVAVGEADVRAEDNIATGDGIIVKYDSNGEKKWQTTLEGDDTDLFYDVVESKDGNFYAIGKSFSTDIINNPNAYSNAIIVKYSPTGTMLDIKYMHDNGKQIDYNAIAEVEDNKFAIVGEKDVNGAKTGFLAIWRDGEANPSYITIAPDGRQTEIFDIIKTSDGNIVVAGMSMMNMVSAPYMAMFDKDGNSQWEYRIENDDVVELSNLVGRLISVIEDKDGNFVAVGQAYDEKTNALMLVIDKTGKSVNKISHINKDLEGYSSVLINSKNEILAVGKNDLEQDKSILDNSKIFIDAYNADYSKKTTNSLYPSLSNVVSSDALITANDEIILVGESFKAVESVDAKCKVANEQLADECIHSDSSILKVKFKEEETCVITEKPQINADNKIVNKGDTFDPKKDVTAIDGEKNDLTQKIEVLTNTVDTSKEGEYIVKYKVEDKCGNTTEKEIKVTVVEKKVESATDENKDENGNKDENKTESTEKPQTSDNMLAYTGLSMISSLGLYKYNRKNKK